MSVEECSWLMLVYVYELEPFKTTFIWLTLSINICRRKSMNFKSEGTIEGKKIITTEKVHAEFSCV